MTKPSIEDLDGTLRERAYVALSSLVPDTFRIDRVYSTEGEQYALWAQGRLDLQSVNWYRRAYGMWEVGEKDNKYTVTECSGKPISEGGTGVSLHQLRCAIDICVYEKGKKLWPSIDDPRWMPIARAMRGVGFAWGGDWFKWKDPAHYELLGGVLSDIYHYIGPTQPGSRRWT